MVPNSQRINRGGLILSELVESCRNHGFTDIVVLHEHRGEPGGWRASSKELCTHICARTQLSDS